MYISIIQVGNLNPLIKYMAGSYKVPCSECGKLVSISTNESSKNTYCDKFCEAKSRIKTIRGKNKKTTTLIPSKPKRKCCGG